MAGCHAGDQVTFFTLDWLYVDVTREGPDWVSRWGPGYIFSLDWMYVDMTREKPGWVSRWGPGYTFYALLAVC